MSIAHFCELLAAEIHTNFLNGDTQSTTTVCFNGANGTLYVATQGDKLNLQHLLQPKERQATHALLMKNQLATGSAGGYKKLKVGAVAPTGQDRLPDAWQLIDQVSASMQGAGAPLSRQDVAAVKWVTRFDLVTDDGAFQGTGFHGESYIIRYLALKDLRGVQALPNNQTVEQLEQKSTEALRNALEQHFADSYRGTLHMGSSQGACSRCAEFMKSLGIAYVTTQTRDSKREDTWRHPFTMTTKASGNHSRHANSHLWMAPKLVAIRAAKPAREVGGATSTQ